MYNIHLLTLVALQVRVASPQSVLSAQHCFEYCRYLLYRKQPILDPRCDCSSVSELFARFMAQSRSAASDEALALPQNYYEAAPVYPIQIIPYLENQYLLQKPFSRVASVKETEDIKINNSSLKHNNVEGRLKAKKYKKQSSSKADRSDVGKQMNYTVHSDKDPFKFISRMRKPDSILEREIGRIRNFSGPVKSNPTPGPIVTKSSISSTTNDSVAPQDKPRYEEFHGNINTPVEELSAKSFFTDKDIKEGITTKNQRDYFKEQSSPFTTNNTDYNVFVIKKSKATDKNDTGTLAPDDLLPTQHEDLSTTTETSVNHKHTIATPNHIYNEAVALRNNNINRETYQEHEVPLHKIITKEFSNGSVISIINGTEKLNDEFIDELSIDNKFARTNITLVDLQNIKLPKSTTKSNQSISGPTPFVSANFNLFFVSYILSGLDLKSSDKTPS